MGSWLLHLIEAIGDLVLSNDPAGLAQLSPYAGRAIKLELTDWKITLYIVIEETGLTLHSAYSKTPDVIVRAPVAVLLRYAVKGRTNVEAKGGIAIEGDLQLLQAVFQVLQQLHIDGEAMVAHYVGDVPAYYMRRVTAQLCAIKQEVCASLLAATEQYLHDEAAIAVTAAEVAQFVAEVSTLRHDVARLTARVDRLVQRQEKI